jgi:3-oxoacyl-[acyl-carrier protein] reductase
VNAVAPGAVDTPMTAPMQGVQEIVDSELAHIPLRRFGSVTEIAPTVAFLCTEQCSYTSGAVVVVDGASDCV